jgi:hypothetical protein
MSVRRLPLPLLAFVLLSHAPLHAQTIEDGIMMGRRLICAGYMYTNDQWDHYWEGALKRTNGNIGTLTTESHQIFANYGVTNNLNVIVHLPRVSTNASAGVMSGQKGWQDATFAAKYKFFQTAFTERGTLRAIAVVQGSVPMTDYTPDVLPFSIGLASRRIAGRGTIHYRDRTGFFVNGTSAYTFRDGVTLDRPFYYTNGKLVFSDRVDMPNTVDYSVSSGLIRGELVLSGMFSEMRTLGGGDIRRQDMPFVSNCMDASRVGFWAKVPIPKHHNISIVGGYNRVIAGRNVGQSNTFTIGMMYLGKLPLFWRKAA